MSSEISTSRLIVRSVIWFGIMFALLFAGAGTVAWPEAWLYILVQCSYLAVMVLWLKKHNPELLQERMDFWKRLVKPWDKAIMILFVAVYVPSFILPGLDAVRYQWSHVPLSLKIAGFAGILVSSGLIFRVLKTNPYSSAAFEVQKDRGHKVVSTGPYQYVRHPMYAGAILSFFCIPLALGSLITLITGAILTALIVVRTCLEDTILHQELEGYTAYAQIVEYRLIPGIW